MKPFKHYAVLLPFLFFSVGRTLAMTTLGYTPSTQMVGLGDQVTIDIYVSNLSGDLIGSYDFFVNWDASLLTLSSVDFGTSLGGPLDSLQSDPLTDSTNPSFGDVGTANLAEVSLVFDLSTLQTGSDPFTLFSLSFDTLAVGTSPFAFAPGLSGDFLGDDLGTALVTDASATSTVTIVPVPAAVWLLLSGLGPLTWAGKRARPSARCAHAR